MKSISISDKAHAMIVKEQAFLSMKKGVKLPLSSVLDKLLKIKEK